jgi:pimeloyl-ACP methyl ester carboxylesterase
MAVEVHHELSGPPDARVVALSCSLGTDLSMWDPQEPRLSETLRVLRYDLRGHGRSPVPPGPYSIADLGRDLIALLDRLEISRASLCGVSIGGMMSLWVAANALDRVERLVVCCSSAHIDPDGMYRDRARAVRENLLATPVEGYAACCEALADMDLRDALSAIRAPTLVLSGREDPATPPSHGRLIADGIPGARFEVIDDAAHLANLQRPDLVAELIERHVAAPTPAEQE